MPDPGAKPKWLSSSRLADAAAYAINLHCSDARKGTEIPYVSHLFSVCGLVIADGGTEDEAIAGLLHDALEDHPERTSRAEIARRFGEHVAEIVAGCSDTPADYAGGVMPLWSRFNAGKADQIWYLSELARIFSECRADGLLLDEFLIVVQELARRVRET